MCEDENEEIDQINRRLAIVYMKGYVVFTSALLKEAFKKGNKVSAKEILTLFHSFIQI